MQTPHSTFTVSMPSAALVSKRLTHQGFWEALWHAHPNAKQWPHEHMLIQAAAGCAAYSPYLARLLLRHPTLVETALLHQMDAAYALLNQRCEALDAYTARSDWMREARVLKEQVALLVALADVGGIWPLARITRALSEFAELAVQSALRLLLRNAAEQKEIILPDPSAPEQDCQIIVLGMGKLGAYELNYSSDIDLILLYDREKLRYTGNKNAQHFMNRIAQDLVQLMQERTADGYVFRTDLRLRPDPMSTPPAVSVAAALTYYETLGQNWERAAMIKARPIAGDKAAGEAFLRELIPYVWRKNLDFAAIADIYSIKRQMNAGADPNIMLAGHNIKTGLGGIREIEFFVQTQQLVWGGRIPSLRVRGTLDALHALYEAQQLDGSTRDTLAAHYTALRTLEHRLQMREDAQTHSLPEDAPTVAEVGEFCGFTSIKSFEDWTLHILSEVHRNYAESMQDSPPLSADGNLVFTGVEADAETLKTLGRMGYTETQRISDIIQGWHRGHRRATRSKRARQLLTELIPAILKALGKTANPDGAFFQFDDFLDKLPVGAQIFSLMHARTELLDLVAQILGSAPALGHTLGANPLLLDSVLEPDFFTPLPDKAALEEMIHERLAHSPDYEQAMIFLRIFHNEKRFQAGVHMLQHRASSLEVSRFLSALAEVIVATTLAQVRAVYEQDHPATRDMPLAILGFGRLGAGEMTFGSDIDMVFLYDDAGDSASEKRTHMQRICQRVITALTTMTREGRLYEVDTRLRPGGNDGPLATSVQAFDAYFNDSAWTFERMALTKARVVACNQPAFAQTIRARIAYHVTKQVAAEKIHHDVFDMRQRLDKEHGSTSPLDIKHVRGGLVDIEFLAQYLILLHSHQYPSLYKHTPSEVFAEAKKFGLLQDSDADYLILAARDLSGLLSFQRLCAHQGIATTHAPIGLKRLLAEISGTPDFDALLARLSAMQAQVLKIVRTIEFSGVSPSP